MAEPAQGEDGGAAPETSRTDVELLTEHFGYPPVSLLDDIINTVNILAESALTSIEQFLLSHPAKTLGFRDSKPPSTTTPITAADAAKFEIDNGTHQFETLLCSSIDRTFDIFELYVVRELLCVPPEDRDWIRLRHYEGLDFDRVLREGVAGAPSVESVGELWARVRASQRLNVLLKAERVKNEALLRKLRGVLGVPLAGEEAAEGGEGEGGGAKAERAPLGFLAELGSLTEGGSEAPVETSTAFALSQLQALRSLSAALKNMAPDLVAAADAGDAAGDGDKDRDAAGKNWRRERVEYVEGQTRRHLEDVRGLELGPQGAVRDGEWQGEGRKFTRREVEALEEVVGALGGEEKPDAMDES